MIRGKFIVFEGGEGTGKSTQARLLAQALEDQGIATILTREPGGTPGAEAIREILLHPPGAGWAPRAEAMLFAAARSDHVERLIAPALGEGRWVVCDRFLDSSRAYQGFAGDLGDDIVRSLHAHGSEGLRPDLTIVLAVPVARTAERLSRRDGDASDAIAARDAGYHARVDAAFQAFARDEPKTYALIDGEGTEQEVHNRVLAAVEQLAQVAS